MKILFVIHVFPPYSLGGSEIYTARLTAELAKRHEVFVAARGQVSAEAGHITTEKRPDCTIYWIHPEPLKVNDFKHAYDNAQVDRAFCDILSTVRPDVVHVHGVWSLSNNLPILARGRGIPVVFTLHDFWLMCPRGQRLRPSDLSVCWEIDLARCTPCMGRWIDPPRVVPPSHLVTFLTKSRYPVPILLGMIYRRVFRRRGPHLKDGGSEVLRRYHERTREVIDAVSLFIAPSEFLRSEFIRYGIPPEKILYSDNGYNVAHFEALSKVPADTLRFGFVGTFSPSKGVHLLIEAFRALSTDRAELLIFGGPHVWADSDYTEELHRTGQHPRIRFMGTFPPDRVAEVFSQIDVLVIPSLWFENSPLTIKEALLSKTPVIASRLGGMAEYVRDGVNGLLFSPGDVTDLRDKMEHVLQNPHLLSTLTADIPPVKTIQENAVELEKIYGSLLSRASINPACEERRLER